MTSEVDEVEGLLAVLEEAEDESLAFELRRAKLDPISDVSERNLHCVSRLVRVIYHGFFRQPEDKRLELYQAAERRVRSLERRRLLPTEKPSARRSSRGRSPICQAKREERGLAAGEQYIGEHGQLGSVRGYDAWLDSGEAPEGLPRARWIIRTFGKWERFRVELAMLPMFDARAVGLAGRGRDFSTRELKTMIRACALDAGYKAVGFDTIYKPFAEKQMTLPLAERTCPRFAVSRTPFRNNFNNWQAARVKATADLDLPERRPRPPRAQRRPRPSRPRPIPAPRWGSEQPTRLDDTAYSKDAYFEALRDADANCEARMLTESPYTARRRVVVAEAAERGEVIPLLAASSVRRFFGSFPDGLFETGLITEAERRLRLRAGGRAMDDDEVRASVELIAENEGVFVSGRAYRRRRHRLLEESHDDELVIASHLVVAERFGGGDFDEAIRRLLRPDDPPGSSPRHRAGRPRKNSSEREAA